MTLHRLRTPLVASGVILLASPRPAVAEGSLNLIPDPWTLGTLLVLFLALVPVLNAVLFQPLLGVLEERERRIEGARQRSEQLARQANETLSRYEASVREARVAAEAARKEALAAAAHDGGATVQAERGRAESTLERARGEIQSALASARTQLRSEAESLAREAATRLLGRAL